MRKLILISILILSSAKSIADENSNTSVQSDSNQENTEITETQVHEAIQLLIRAGILEFKDGHLQEKKIPVAVEQPKSLTPTQALSICGRIRQQNVNPSSICLKAECI